MAKKHVNIWFLRKKKQGGGMRGEFRKRPDFWQFFFFAPFPYDAIIIICVQCGHHNDDYHHHHLCKMQSSLLCTMYTSSVLVNLYYSLTQTEDFIEGIIHTLLLWREKFCCTFPPICQLLQESESLCGCFWFLGFLPLHLLLSCQTIVWGTLASLGCFPIHPLNKDETIQPCMMVRHESW